MEEAKWRVLTAPYYLVDKDGLQWRSFKASIDMLATTVVPLRQVGLVTHFWNDVDGVTQRLLPIGKWTTLILPL